MRRVIPEALYHLAGAGRSGEVGKVPVTRAQARREGKQLDGT